MVRIAEVTGYADVEHPLEISLPTPSPEMTSALLLIERLDDGQDEVDITIDGMPNGPKDELGKNPSRASLHIATLAHEAQRILASIRPRVGGWFRARIVWVRGRLPDGACYLCRRALGTMVAAAFALIGVPMPDFTLDDIAPDIIGDLLEAIKSPPLSDFLEQIHEDLGKRLTDAIAGIDLVQKTLGRIYRYCCERLGLCKPQMW